MVFHKGTVLGPVLFAIFRNDLPDYCGNSSEMFLFADDAKIFKHVRQNSDALLLNEYCQKLYAWCNIWLMKLNVNKCKV